MEEGFDYCFIYPKDDTTNVHVKILEGVYKNTVFKYGKVKFQEISEEMHLVFAYDVLESPVTKPKTLEKDEDFKNYIGNLLVEIMSGNLQQDLIDETRTTDTE